MKRLLIDLDMLEQDKSAKIECEYFYHPNNNGLVRIYELVNFAVVCRKCKDAPCVASCPKDALEKDENNILKRYSMRCVSCKTCSHACPFGTIYPETIPYLISQCDYCVGRLQNGTVPLCVMTCKSGGIKYGDFHPDEKNGIYSMSDAILVKVKKWDRV
ncbi:MAG: 4Fe-4S ferredoxin [Candidatus Omnitrophica bacterium CG07_land_8_20_14_0_80_42_15]|uniref:4Fe-4S ferredoxin n=1 Tax=Candidatus Aquitaenariimonas noxiae TaxID=1974741 RepID=A0A2J0KT95_9BACT|nr:MAG: 4Fe-4S ferredoxin [Candidatus Omnitrophica bacterium CG07_land_8_20_14_0_80_42_15]